MCRGWRAATAATILVSLAALTGCPRTSTETSPQASFPRWYEDFGPLAMTQSEINEGRNWYLPVAFAELDMSRRLWTRDFSHAGHVDYIYASGYVFFAGSEDYLGALDAATGDTVWEVRPAPSKEPRILDYQHLALTPYSLVSGAEVRGRTDEVRFHSPLTGELLRVEEVGFALQQVLVTAGRVVVLGERGECAVFAQETGELLAAAFQPTDLDVATATVENLLLLGKEAAAHSLELGILEPVASRMLESRCWFPFILDGELILSRMSDEQMLALDLHDLTTVWHFPLEGWPSALPAGYTDHIFYGEANGNLRCVQPSVKRTLWVHNLEAPAYVFIVFDNCLIALADYVPGEAAQNGEGAASVTPSWHEPGAERSHCLYVLDNTDGSVLAQFPGPGQLMPKLVTPNGIVMQEDLGGPISCFPATITPTENAQ
jgi:outer membrane protein assembly factor BamB